MIRCAFRKSTTPIIILVLATAAIAALPRPAAATALFTAGHGDVGIVYEDGALQFELHVEDAGVAYDPGEAAIVVPAAALENRKSSPAYDAIGVAANAPFYKLAQGSFEAATEQLPFVGLAAEEVPLGIFKNNLLRLSLVSVEGPGHFSLWRETATGPGFESRPGFVGIPLASSDGVDAIDHVFLPASLHEHANWGFTERGTYFVTLRAEGELLSGETLAGEGTFRFDVVPVSEPASLYLAASAAALVWRSRRKRNASIPLPTSA